MARATADISLLGRADVDPLADGCCHQQILDRGAPRAARWTRHSQSVSRRAMAIDADEAGGSGRHRGPIRRNSVSSGSFINADRRVPRRGRGLR
jgi:hypothetical protein